MKSLAVLALLSMVAAGFGCRSYQPGSFTAAGSPFPGSKVTLECFDVAVAANVDEIAAGSVARFSIANRCDHATVVDFTQLRAHARGESGWHAVAPNDPRGELRPAVLEARSVATEFLEFPATSATICFELSGLAGVAPSPETRVCLQSRIAEVTRRRR